MTSLPALDRAAQEAQLVDQGGASQISRIALLVDPGLGGDRADSLRLGDGRERLKPFLTAFEAEVANEGFHLGGRTPDDVFGGPHRFRAK